MQLVAGSCVNASALYYRQQGPRLPTDGTYLCFSLNPSTWKTRPTVVSSEARRKRGRFHVLSRGNPTQAGHLPGTGVVAMTPSHSHLQPCWFLPVLQSKQARQEGGTTWPSQLKARTQTFFQAPPSASEHESGAAPPCLLRPHHK